MLDDPHAICRRIEENAELLEFKCVEFAEEFMQGHYIEDSND